MPTHAQNAFPVKCNHVFRVRHTGGENCVRACFSISRAVFNSWLGNCHTWTWNPPPPAHMDKPLGERPALTIKIDGPPESLHNSEITSDDYSFIKQEQPFFFFLGKKNSWIYLFYFFFKKRGLANPNEKLNGTDTIYFISENLYGCLTHTAGC